MRAKHIHLTQSILKQGHLQAEISILYPVDIDFKTS